MKKVREEEKAELLKSEVVLTPIDEQPVSFKVCLINHPIIIKSCHSLMVNSCIYLEAISYFLFSPGHAFISGQVIHSVES